MNNVKKLTLTAMFMALGLVLPFLTGQIPQIGSMLLPMHIPVFFCALICGWQWATPMALVLPVLRSMFFGMPPMYPTAVEMAFELAAYAFVAGFIYHNVKKQNLATLYASIIAAMIVGRVVLGIAKIILWGFGGKPFTFAAFFAEAVTRAIPGIILQLILIPLVMLALDRAKLVKFRK